MGLATAATIAFLLLSVVALESTVHGAVHHIDVVVPRGFTPNTRAALSHRQSRLHGPLADAVTSLPVTGFGDFVGNVSLGNPPQTLRLKFSFPLSNLYVIGPNASYYSKKYHTFTPVTNKQIYNASASSSYAVVNGSNFSFDHNWRNGTVGLDVLQVGDGLQNATVSVEIVDTVYERMRHHPYDGEFGLSSVIAGNTSSTLLSQLQSSLDSPVFTLFLNDTHGSAKAVRSGRITLGGLAPDLCQSDWVAVANRSGSIDHNFPEFTVTSASITLPGDQGGCDRHVDVPTTVHLHPSTGPMRTSIQMLELFAQACNATLNRTTRFYELSPDQVANAQPVYLHLANGETLRMDPDDYIAEYVSEWVQIVWEYYNSAVL